MNKAIYLEQLNHKEEASRVLDFLWSERENIKSLDVILNIYDVKAKIFKRSKMFIESIKIANEGIEIAELNRKIERSAELWSTLGSIYKKINNLQSAEECFYMALAYEDKIEKPYLFLDIKRQLGELYLTKEQPKDAKSILGKALRNVDLDKRKNTSVVRYTETLITLGECLYQLDLLDDAQQTYERSLELSKKYNLSSLEHKTLFMLSQFWENIDETKFYKYLVSMYKIEAKLKQEGGMIYET